VHRSYVSELSRVVEEAAGEVRAEDLERNFLALREVRLDPGGVELAQSGLVGFLERLDQISRRSNAPGAHAEARNELYAISLMLLRIPKKGSGKHREVRPKQIPRRTREEPPR
jgi:hypothetical protein